MKQNKKKIKIEVSEQSRVMSGYELFFLLLLIY